MELNSNGLLTITPLKYILDVCMFKLMTMQGIHEKIL